jgi:8-amino-7-oxononanoate synthase
MDGDTPDLTAIAEICKKHNAYLIVDEAHAIGVVGRKGEGLVQSLGLQDAVFARVVTFGKALGSHGAAILSSAALRDYLVNYARSLIYTTGLSPHTVALTIAGYTQLEASTEREKQHCAIEKLQSLIAYFNQQLVVLQLDSLFIESHSAIHCAVISSNERVKKIAVAIQSKGYDVRPILSPTVPVGQERLRICLHTQNTHDHIDGLLVVLKEAMA